MASLCPNPIQFQFRNPKSPFRRSNPPYIVVLSNLASSPDDSSKPALRISADSAPKARFIARRTESVTVRQLQRPLTEYMSLPASQYSVLDAERIERVDDNTFRCYVYRFKFFAFEVCPVLLVRVEEQPNGCCINLLSCTLEGSPIVVAQNDKFDASMENKISCDSPRSDSLVQKLTSDAVIEVSIDIPFAFRAIPTESIESTGSQVLGQILKAMLPRFMSQLVKDYQAWASGDTSRQPLGTVINHTRWGTRSAIQVSLGSNPGCLDKVKSSIKKLSEKNANTELGAIAMSWRHILAACPYFKLRNIRRERNAIAHCLARLVLDLDTELVWDEPPTAVEGLLHIPCSCLQ